MNEQIREILESSIPKLKDLPQREVTIYQAGLNLLALEVCENFLDMPRIDIETAKITGEGLFYEIPFLDSSCLAWTGNKRDLLVIWKVGIGYRECPLRIEFEYPTNLEDNYCIWVHKQIDSDRKKIELVRREGDKRYTQVERIETIKLSELLEI